MRQLRPVYGPSALSMRIINQRTGEVYDPSDGVEAMSTTVEFAASIIVVEKDTLTNRFTPEIPALPAGVYDVLLFETETPNANTAVYLPAQWREDVMAFKSGEF